MKKVFVILPPHQKAREIYEAIKEVTSSFEASVKQIDDVEVLDNVADAVYEEIESADLLIFDVTSSDSNVIYELGYAHALKKSVILIEQRTDKPSFTDLSNSLKLTYDVRTIGYLSLFKRRLVELVKKALENPDEFRRYSKEAIEDKNVFISYSHKDIDFLNRLLIHLQPLEQEGVIDFWVDTKIKAGDKWRNEIEKALKRARVAILLISADFLASEFIVKNELPPLLDKAELEGTRIIPVIIKPCRFARDKNLSRFQAINPPTSPLINLAEGERESIYDQVAEAVEKLMVK